MRPFTWDDFSRVLASVARGVCATMEQEIDTDRLISLVQERPVLWDKTTDIYKDRNATRSAWKEVCVELKPEFEEMEDNAKNIFSPFQPYHLIRI